MVNQKYINEISILSAKNPTLTSGSEVRNYYLLQTLTRKYKAHIIVPKSSITPSLVKRIFYLLTGKIPYIENLKNTSLNKKELTQLLSSKVIQFQEHDAFFVFEKYLRQYKGLKVLDAHNIDYLRFKAEIETKDWVSRLIGYYLSWKLKKIEVALIKQMDYVFCCSQIDKNYFSQYIDPTKITVIPNGVDTKRFTPKKYRENNEILFMGLLSYPSNIQGLKYYVEKIHPIVITKIPEATLVIIGKHAPQWLKEAAKVDASIKLMGYVDDVRDYINKATVCICPLLSGSGTRLKLLEYMALSKAIVSTSKGAEGLAVKNTKNCIIADSIYTFSDAIVELIDKREKRQKLGASARLLVEEKYDWGKIQKLLIDFYVSIL